MSSGDSGSAVDQAEAKATGTEFNSHMTNDGAPNSHSAQFGLSSKDGKEHKKDSGRQPGDVIAGGDKDTSGAGSGPTPAQPETKTAAMADGTSTDAPPGAGSTEGATDKVNPFK